jgi:hypothetical protein
MPNAASWLFKKIRKATQGTAHHARHSTRSRRCAAIHLWTTTPRRPSELAGGAVQRPNTAEAVPNLST